MKTTFIIFSSLVFILFNACKPDKTGLPELPAIFTDHMVLQQNAEVAIWGNANPETKVRIAGSWGQTVLAKTDTLGNFSAKLKTPEAGGPFEVMIKNKKNVVVIKDVMIGEVWLCSGQSNMEMTMNGFSSADTIQGAAQEIKEANFPGMRIFTVRKAMSEKPESDCKGQWMVCSPETAGDFSATAFFFGKKLLKEINVPIGLIHSSWGGTPVESWISGETLKNDADYTETIKQIEDARPEFERYKSWLTNHSTIDMRKKEADEPYKGISFNDSTCSAVSGDDSNWDIMKLPVLWENTKVGSFDGAIWFRKNINIPETWSGKDLQLSLGPIDDMDGAYFNGSFIGGYEVDGFYDKPREYTIPASLVKAGENLIAVRVIDTRGGGGIYGKETDLKISVKENPAKKISLAGEWKYMVAAEFFDDIFYVFDITSNEFKEKPTLSIGLSSWTPSMLYNAMIAPLIPYTIKGAIWYQGESNVGRANQYQRLFPAMITDWRNLWQLGEFPFYFVQIAPWNYSGSAEGIASAHLRDAQRRSLSLPNTGMAVTLDIGNFNNIHPANKTDVGERLALWALNKDYGKELICSGPLYLSHEIVDDKVTIQFEYAENGLVFKNNIADEFEICGEDLQYIKAEAQIDNNHIVVFHPDIKNPVAVRYAYKDGSNASLFNFEGLPASSFTTEEKLP
ncbi:MAG: 9-O-acetylesterase [Bacteroidales bacterium]|nr:9-O-acetylesterase [Bacteroidales bacterium]